MPNLGGRREALILGNGPSLKGRPWHTVPRDEVFILGLNQSWRETQDVDAHLAIDVDQFRMEGAVPYYSAMAKRHCLYHLTQSPTYPTGGGRFAPIEGGIALHRHDAPVFARHPYRKRHRGPGPAPPPSEDGGVVLAVGYEPRGSVGYMALQLMAALPFDRIWMVGFDMNDRKFDGAFGYDKFGAGKQPTYTGAYSASRLHDRLWRHVPEDVLARTRVIAPSATQVLQVEPWPWPVAAEAA